MEGTVEGDSEGEGEKEREREKRKKEKERERGRGGRAGTKRLGRIHDEIFSRIGKKVNENSTEAPLPIVVRTARGHLPRHTFRASPRWTWPKQPIITGYSLTNSWSEVATIHSEIVPLDVIYLDD